MIYWLSIFATLYALFLVWFIRSTSQRMNRHQEKIHDLRSALSHFVASRSDFARAHVFEYGYVYLVCIQDVDVQFEVACFPKRRPHAKRDAEALANLINQCYAEHTAKHFGND